MKQELSLEAVGVRVREGLDASRFSTKLVRSASAAGLSDLPASSTNPIERSIRGVFRGINRSDRGNAASQDMGEQLVPHRLPTAASSVVVLAMKISSCSAAASRTFCR